MRRPTFLDFIGDDAADYPRCIRCAKFPRGADNKSRLSLWTALDTLAIAFGVTVGSPASLDGVSCRRFGITDAHLHGALLDSEFWFSVYLN
jgi:hypothetical protein